MSPPPELPRDARVALDFHRSVFGGRITVATDDDAHNVTDPAESDQMMYGEILSDNGFRVMVYDVPSHTAWDPGTVPVFVCVRGVDAEEIAGCWGELAVGATILMPLAPAQWTPLYAMLRDRFGVTGVLDVEIAWEG
ncbi:VOC family protein [Rhodococcus zopfii]|uniref:VOC family protein n=1 Tax=Rhodococcus zopfii TaxID=43772 RepID=UPI001C3F5E98|nr:VOC family protein [Rhodococcus zopfii]